MSRALVFRNGTFLVAAALPHGDYILDVRIGHNSDNLAGYCTASASLRAEASRFPERAAALPAQPRCAAKP